MKKKLLVFLMVGVMAAFTLTACGSKETAAATEAATTVEAVTEAATTEAETTEAETAAADAAAEEDAVIAKYDEYLAWTDKEWSAANEEEKLNAAIAYSVYVTEALGVEEFDDNTKALIVAEMRKTDEVKNVVSQLDTTFPALKVSIKEFADTGIQEVNNLMETAEAAQ